MDIRTERRKGCSIGRVHSLISDSSGSTFTTNNGISVINAAAADDNGQLSQLEEYGIRTCSRSLKVVLPFHYFQYLWLTDFN